MKKKAGRSNDRSVSSPGLQQEEPLPAKVTVGGDGDGGAEVGGAREESRPRPRRPAKFSEAFRRREPQAAASSSYSAERHPFSGGRRSWKAAAPRNRFPAPASPADEVEQQQQQQQQRTQVGAVHVRGPDNTDGDDTTAVEVGVVVAVPGNARSGSDDGGCGEIMLEAVAVDPDEEAEIHRLRSMPLVVATMSSSAATDEDDDDDDQEANNDGDSTEEKKKGRDDTSASKREGKNPRRWKLVLAVALALVLMAVVGAVVGATYGVAAARPPPGGGESTRDGDGDGSGAVTPSPTAAAPESPSPPPTAVGQQPSGPTRYDRIRSAAGDLFGPGTAQAIDSDTASPQAKAAQWMADADKQQLLPDAAGLDNLLWDVPSSARFRQRYALVVFAYSTSVESWRVSTGWLDPAVHECDWYAIGCNDEERVIDLQMSGNYLSGTLPDELAGLAFLQQLWIVDNAGVTGTIPSAIANIEPLERLRLRNLSLSGRIPDGFNGKFNLSHLYLNGNQLTGTVPAGLADMPNLKFLYLYENQLTGPVPGSLLATQTLLELSLRGNGLSGSVDAAAVPAQGGSLVRLNLLGNALSGPLPPQLGNQKNLTFLTVSDNNFTGTVPPSYGNLKKLKALHLNGNSLTGSMPSTICLLRPSNTSLSETASQGQGVLVDLSADCVSKISCSCCTACF